MQLPWERSSYHEKTIRKIKFFKQDYQQRRYDEEENEESDDGFVTEIRQHRKNNGNVQFMLMKQMEMMNNLKQKQNQKLLKKK